MSTDAASTTTSADLISTLPANLRERLSDPNANIMVLTGAGISKAANIPTYRGEGGLYPSGTLIPLTASDARSNKIHELWQRFLPLTETAAQAQPTPAHRALADASAAGRNITVITQNVDGLHRRAGSDPIELHGNLTRARCLNPKCQATTDAPTGPAPETSADVARCELDGARLRPDVILFGENLKFMDAHNSLAAATDADVVLAIGTSLQVHPAAGYVTHALAMGALGAWLEIDPAAMRAELDPRDQHALRDLVDIPGDCQDTLPQLLALA